MSNRRLLAAVTLTAVAWVAGCHTQTVQPVVYKGWDVYVMKNDFVQLHVVPEIGGRVIQYALGEKEFFWVNPALIGKTLYQISNGIYFGQITSSRTLCPGMWMVSFAVPSETTRGWSSRNTAG